MDIRPNMSVASIAGTARAQTEGTDKDRGPSGGGVAESQQISDNLGLHEGTRSGDRDADGRQLLDYHPENHRDSHSSDDKKGTEHRRAVSSDTEGQKLDLEA